MRTKHRRNAMTDPGSYTLRTTEPHLSHALCSYTGSTRGHGIADVLPLVVLLVAVAVAVAVAVPRAGGTGDDGNGGCDNGNGAAGGDGAVNGGAAGP